MPPTSETSTRGPYAKGIERRQQIVDAALEAFAQRGFARLSLRAIADSMKISHGTILHYFPSLEDVLVEILIQHDQKVYESAERDIDGSLLDELIASAQFNINVRAMIALHTTMLGQSVESTNSQAKAFFTARFDEGRVNMGRAIEQGYAARGVQGSDPKLVASVVMAAFDGLQIQWLLDPTLDIVVAIRALQPLVGDAPAGAMPFTDERLGTSRQDAIENTA